MTNSKTIEVINHLRFLTEKGYVAKTSDEPLVYNLTEKGKLLNNETEIK